jgi:hypothetical protein
MCETGYRAAKCAGDGILEKISRREAVREIPCESRRVG